MSLKKNPAFIRTDVEVLSQEPLLSSYLKVEKLQVKFKLFGGGWSQIFTRERMKRADAVAVLLYHAASDQIVLVEQLRMGLLDVPEKSPWILEPVMGIIEAGDTPEQTAHKEAFEEAGCTITQLIPIGTYIVSPGISTEQTVVFCGLMDRLPLDNSIHGLQAEGEDIRLHVIASTTAFGLLRPDNPMSASAIIVLQWLQLNRNKLIDFKGP
jgi:ADP-ribose pyrophosphatase